MNAATRAASISAVAALVLAAVWLFWPMTLGGGTTYVTTHGISMEPGFHTGDLAVLRSSDRYSVGDVVAYHSETIDTIVMHRIVAMADDGLVTQGDNNDWLDEDRPTDDQILGSLFLRVPQGGKALDTLRSPGALALVAAAAIGVLGSTRRPRGRRESRSRGQRPASLSMPGLSMPSFSMPTVAVPAFSPPARALARQVALASGGTALLAAAAVGALFLVPSSETVAQTLQVKQQGQFSYTGSAVPGTTYPSGVVTTGDTVWTKLVTGLTVSFTNTVSGPELADVHGVMRLDVSVAAADGWSAYLASSPVVQLENGTATASVAIDSAAASALLSRHHAEIGTSGATATLTVVPAVATTGTARGTGFTAGSPAGLSFTLDPTSIRLTGSEGTALAPSTQTAVAVDEVVPRRFAVLDVAVPIDVARIAAVVVLAAALVALAAGAWIGRTNRGDVADEFAVRHAARILPVVAFDPGPTVIDVSDAEALHRVAERFDTLVLHHAGPDEDTFAVRDLETTYRFVVPNAAGAEARSMPPVPAPIPARPATGALLRRFA